MEAEKAMHEAPLPQALPLQILNLGGFLFAIILNVISTAGGVLPSSPEEMSALYPSRITPAGFTFSVWGVIYFLGALFTIYQALPRSRSSTLIFQEIHVLFFISCLFNGTWILLFSYEQIWASAVIISLLGLTLLAIYLRINHLHCLPSSSSSSRRQGPSSIIDYVGVSAFFSCYLAWISLATVVNYAAALRGVTGWEGAPWTENGWTILMLGVLFCVAMATLVLRQDGAFGLVVVWGVAGVGAAQGEEGEEVRIAAWVYCAVLLVFSLLALAVKALRWRRERRELSVNKGSALS